MDRLLHNNVVLRVIALVLSCILWLAVNTGGGGPDNSGYVKPFTFTVHVEAPSGMVATSVDVQTATVEVQTDAFHAAALAAQMMNVSVVADARGLSPGRHAVPLVALNMPAVAYTLQPAAVNVVLEPLSSAEKPVVVTLSGKPAAGYATGTPQPAAPEVTVSGPQSRVASVARILATVSVDGATQTVNTAASLRAVDANGQPVTGVEVNPGSLRVTVPVQAEGTSLRAAVQITGRPAAGWAVAGVDVSPQNLTVTGAAAATLKSLSIPVDVSGWQSTRTVTVDVPRPAGVDEVVPDRVRVTVHLETSGVKTMTGLPVAVRQAPAGWQVTVHPPVTINVTIAGPQSLVNALQPGDVQVYIEAEGLKKGDQSVPVQVELPPWVQVVQCSPATLQVTAGPESTP